MLFTKSAYVVYTGMIRVLKQVSAIGKGIGSSSILTLRHSSRGGRFVLPVQYIQRSFNCTSPKAIVSTNQCPIELLYLTINVPHYLLF